MADYAASTAFPTLSKQVWPHESMAGELDAFFGDPRGTGGAASQIWERDNLVVINPPWRMNVAHITIHKKCADSVMRILNAVWEYVGKDQSKIDAAHLNEFDGSNNFRPNVNAPSKLSVHSYAAALDFAAKWNPNGKHWTDDGTMLPRWFIDAFLAEGWSWGGDFSVTADAMHMQATFNRHTDAPQEQPHSLPSAPQVPVAALPAVIAATTGDEFADRLRQLLVDLSTASMASQMPALADFKSSVVAQLDALKATVLAFELSTAEAAPAKPAAPSPSPPDFLTAPKRAAPAVPAAPTPISRRYTGITTTMEGGVGDPETSAYTGKPIDPNSVGLSFPFHFVGTRPQGRVFDPDTGRSQVGVLVDVGPWNMRDPYVLTPGARPLAETQFRNKTVAQNGMIPTNDAGMDMTPGMWAALGLTGVGKKKLDFELVTSPSSNNGAPAMPLVAVQTGSALTSKINWTAAVKIIGTGATLLSAGKLNLTPEMQLVIVSILNLIGDPLIIIFRTWFSKTVTPQSLPSPQVSP